MTPATPSGGAASPLLLKCLLWFFVFLLLLAVLSASFLVLVLLGCSIYTIPPAGLSLSWTQPLSALGVHILQLSVVVCSCDV